MCLEIGLKRRRAPAAGVGPVAPMNLRRECSYESVVTFIGMRTLIVNQWLRKEFTDVFLVINEVQHVSGVFEVGLQLFHFVGE